jgi:hypothetical protein
VWALGATLYTAVEGHPPFGKPDGNILRFLQRVATQQVPPPVAAGPLTPVIMRLLQRNPAARPSLAEAAAILHAVAGGAPAPRPAPTRIADHPSRRLTGRIALVAVSVVAVLAVAVTLLVRGVPPAASPSPAPASPSPVAASPAPDEQAGLGADPRTADPCSLVDAGALAAFGSVDIVADYGEFNTCEVRVAPRDAEEGRAATLTVDLVLPLASGERMVGDISYDGPYLIAREAAPSLGSCTRTIALRGGYQVYIAAIADETATDICGLAEATARAVLDHLRRFGVARRTHPPVPAGPSSLLDVDTCALLVADDIGKAGLSAQPNAEFGHWGCQWVAEGGRLDVSADRRFPLVEGADGTISQVAGRTFYTRSGAGTSERCIVETPQRSFTASDGSTRWETVRVTLKRPDVPSDVRCATATALLAAVANKLPAPTPP